MTDISSYGVTSIRFFYNIFWDCGLHANGMTYQIDTNVYWIKQLRALERQIKNATTKRDDDGLNSFLSLSISTFTPWDEVLSALELKLANKSDILELLILPYGNWESIKLLRFRSLPIISYNQWYEKHRPLFLGISVSDRFSASPTTHL